jgi:hypothetical protein
VACSVALESLYISKLHTARDALNRSEKPTVIGIGNCPSGAKIGRHNHENSQLVPKAAHNVNSGEGSALALAMMISIG